MDITLKQDNYERFVPVFRGETGRELSTEVIVPDSMPDAETVADAHGLLWITGKDAAAGHVTVTGTLSVSVLYLPPADGAPQCLELELPAELRLEAPEADGDCRTCASLRLCALEARAVNSRKLSVRAEVYAAAECWRRETVSLASDLAEGAEQAHVLRQTAEAMFVTDVRERTYVITDELPVPTGLSGSVRVLSRRVSLIADDVRCVRDKAVIRGRAVSELMFGDEEGRLRPGRFETEFTQIMETDCREEDALCSARLMLTGAFFDLPAFGEGAGRLTAELHFTVQCVCRERRQLAYLADIYANRTLLVPSFADSPIVTAARPVSVRQTVAGRAEPPAEGELLCLSAALAPAVLEDSTVKTSVLVRLACRTPDGRCTVSRCRLSAEFTPPELPDDAVLTDVAVAAEDVYAAGSDVRVVLRMDALAVTEGVLHSVCAVAEDREGFLSLPRKPSATLVRTAPGTGLWELAKRCGSSPEAIAAANDGRRDGLLLIPKTR